MIENITTEKMMISKFEKRMNKAEEKMMSSTNRETVKRAQASWRFYMNMVEYHHAKEAGKHAAASAYLNIANSIMESIKLGSF